MTAQVLGKVMRQLVKKLILSGIIIGICMMVMQVNQAIGVILMMLYSSLMVLNSSRREMPLGKFTALLPGGMSIITFSVMLGLIHLSEPVMPIIGIGLGIVAGFLMARGHKVYRKNGLVYSKRTFFYILIWVFSMLFTQGSTLVGMREITDFGFLLSGFSTAMMVVLSLFLFKKMSNSKKTKYTNYIAIFFLLFLFVLTIMPSPAISKNSWIGEWRVAGNFLGKIQTSGILDITKKYDGLYATYYPKTGFVKDIITLPISIKEQVIFIDINRIASTSEHISSVLVNGSENFDEGFLEALKYIKIIRQNNKCIIYSRSISKGYGNTKFKLGEEYPSNFSCRQVAHHTSGLVSPSRQSSISSSSPSNYAGELYCSPGDEMCCFANAFKEGGPVAFQQCISEGMRFNPPQPGSDTNSSDAAAAGAASALAMLLAALGMNAANIAAQETANAFMAAGQDVDSDIETDYVDSGNVILDGPAAEDWMRENGYFNQEGTPTQRYYDFMNSLPSENAGSGLQGFAGYTDDNGTPDGNFSIIVTGGEPPVQEERDSQYSDIVQDDEEEVSEPSFTAEDVQNGDDEQEEPESITETVDDPPPVEQSRESSNHHSPDPGNDHTGTPGRGDTASETQHQSGQDKNSEQPGTAVADAQDDEPGYFGTIYNRVRDGVKDLGTELYNASRDVYNDTGHWDDKDAPSISRMTYENIKDELSRTADDAYESVGSALDEVKNAFSDVVRDPSILSDTLSGSRETVVNGVDDAGRFARDSAEDLRRAAEDVYEDPEIIKDTLSGMADTVGDGADHVIRVVSDPDKVVDGIKDLTGIQNFENSVDENRTLTERLGNVALGTFNMAGAVSGAEAAGQAIKEGATTIIGEVGRAAGNFVDDAGRIAASSIDDAGRIGAAGIENVADDAARGAATLGDKADDAIVRSVETVDNAGEAMASPHLAESTAADLTSGLTNHTEAMMSEADSAVDIDNAFMPNSRQEDLVELVSDSKVQSEGATVSDIESLLPPNSSQEDTVEWVSDPEVLNPIHDDIGGVSSESFLRNLHNDFYLRSPDGKLTKITDQAVVDFKPRGRQLLIHVHKDSEGKEIIEIAKYGDKILPTEHTGLKNRVYNEYATLKKSAVGEGTGSIAAHDSNVAGKSRTGITLDHDDLPSTPGAGKSDYEQYLEKGTSKNRVGSTIRPGTTADFVPADVPPDTSGYTEASQRHIKMVADQHGVKIHTRPTTSYARDLLENDKALPKPQLVKNKTINEFDTLLGAKPEDLGKVGHFEPHLPEQGGVSDEYYGKLQERYRQRLQEFKDQSSYLANHGDKLDVKNGLVLDRRTGKPFTGDVDGFAIRGMDNEPLPAAVVERVERDLQYGIGGTGSTPSAPINVQHGVHEGWDYSDLSRVPQEDGGQSKFDIAKNIDSKIRGSHEPGGEALVTYSAEPGMEAPDPDANYWTGGRDNPLVDKARKKS